MTPDRQTPDPSPLKSLLGSAASRYGLDDALATGSLWKRWAAIVGDDVAAHAQPTSLRGGVLRVRADSPVWAHEIGYLAEEIRSKVNAALGSTVVSEVKVWNAPGAPESRSSSGTPRGPVPASSGDDGTTAGKAADLDPQEALGRARKAWFDRRARSRGAGL